MGYHGYIVLLVYVSSAVTAAGTFAQVRPGRANVNRGTNIGGVARAANKGAVGFAFRLYDATVAVVSCHLAADKKGKVHVSKRLDDTREVLHGLELEV